MGEVLQAPWDNTKVRGFVNLLTSWGPLGIFFLAILDSAGIPLPAAVDALLVTLAVVDPRGAYLAALVAVIGSAIGSILLFGIAHKGGRPYLDRMTAGSPRARRFRQWFQEYGLVTVFIPALLPIPLPLKVFVLSAGALGVAPVRFLVVVMVARIPRYFGLAWLGAEFGDHSLLFLKEHVWHLLGFAVVLGCALVLLIRWRKAAGPVADC